MSTVGDISVKLGADADALHSGLSKATSAIGAFGSGVGKTVSSALKGFAMLGAGALVVAGGLAALGTKAIIAAGNMEAVTVAFTTMLGSADKANKLMQDLQKFAATTPFEFTEIQQSAKSLLAFGTTAEDMTKTLRTLGDISSGVGMPLNELAQIYGKAQVSGRLFGEDINQLTGRGIPIIKELAKQFGVSEDKVKGLVEEGKIGFPQLQKAFENMAGAGGQFGGMMDAQSKTLLGMISNLKDAVGQSSVAIGQSLTDAFDIKSIIGGLTESVGTIGPAINAANGDFGKIGTVIGDALSGVLDTILNILPNMVDAGLSVVESIVKGLIKKAPFLAQTGMDMIGWLYDSILKTLPSLIKVVATIGPKMAKQGVGIIMSFVNGVLKNLPDILDAGLEIIEALLDGFIEALPELQTTINEIIPEIVDLLTKDAPKLMDSGLAIFNALLDGLVANLPLLVDSAVAMVTRLVSALTESNTLGKLADAAITLITALVSALTKEDTLGKLADAAISIITSLANALARENTLGKLADAAVSIVTSLANSLTKENALGKLTDSALKVIEALVDSISKNLLPLSDAALTILNKLAEELLTADNLTNLISSAADLIGALVSALLDPKNLQMIADTGLGIVNSLSMGIIGNTAGLNNVIPSLFSTLATQIANTDWTALGKQIGNAILISLANYLASEINRRFGITYVPPTISSQSLGAQSGNRGLPGVATATKASGKSYIPPSSMPKVTSGSGLGFTPGGGSMYIPQYAFGSSFVPRSTLAYVHRGEEIIPAEENRKAAVARATPTTVQQPEGDIVVNVYIDDVLNTSQRIAKRKIDRSGRVTIPLGVG